MDPNWITAAATVVIALGGIGAAAVGAIRRPLAAIHRRFDEMNGRFDNVDKRFDVVDRELDAVRFQQQVIVGALKAHGPSPLSDTISNIIDFQPRVGAR